MANVVLFHSVLGLREGVKAAADTIRRRGHTVHVPDLFEGKIFDDYGSAMAAFEAVGLHELMKRVRNAVVDIEGDLVFAGFSIGGGFAEMMAATHPRAKGCLLFHAALPLRELQLESWPEGVPVQVHYAAGDPWRNDEWVAAFSEDVHRAGAEMEFYEYLCEGHLFADPDLPEYDKKSAMLMWERVLMFLDNVE